MPMDMSGVSFFPLKKGKYVQKEERKSLNVHFKS